MSNEYEKEIEQAKINLADVRKRGEEAIGGNVMDLLDEILTTEEKTASDLRVGIMSELIKARNENGLSQRKLEELSGVKQPVIARMENGTNNPHLETVLKVLAPLGKTLYIGDLKR